jgi:hypothetical protein
MYTTIDFKRKKHFIDAVARGLEVTVYQSEIGEDPKTVNGMVTIEGPHHPAAHTWSARAHVVYGTVVSVQQRGGDVLP